jgi:hypothetical protein
MVLLELNNAVFQSLGITEHDEQKPEKELFLITLCQILKYPFPCLK